jgi:protein-tyrosine kinase
MLGSKPLHLVERVTERLRQNGALDASAAQLLEPGRTRSEAAVPPTDGAATPAAPAVSVVASPLRSPLFAAPPAAVEPAPVLPLATTPAATQPTSTAPSSELPGELHAEYSAEHPLASPTLRSTVVRPIIDMAAMARAGMIDWVRERTRVSEELRLVQRQVLRTAFASPTAQPGFSNLLMVTSARPEEGKSFTSVNLAGSVARQGDHHVLLIDVDPKHASICQALGLSDAPGVLDLAVDPSIDPSDVIVKTEMENLSILPVGQPRRRSAELFASQQMMRLIQAIGRRYSDRLIILDAPPCLSTSDPAALAPVVGQILFVVEAEKTQREEVEASLDLIQACQTITLLLNKVQISTRHTFGAYSSYYTS